MTLTEIAGWAVLVHQLRRRGRDAMALAEAEHGLRTAIDVWLVYVADESPDFGFLLVATSAREQIAHEGRRLQGAPAPTRDEPGRRRNGRSTRPRKRRRHDRGGVASSARNPLDGRRLRCE
jgi:hypothetical protein